MARRARTIDTSEATEAVLLPPRIGSSTESEWDPDLEAAFEQLKEDFRTNANEGTLWVYRVPLDERAEIISAGKQVFLFSAPVDRYSTEELLQKVQSEHMQGLKVTAVRITATKKGERGVRFNQLVLVEAPQRAALPDPASPPRDSSTAELVRAIQESQQATVAMFRELLKPQPLLPAPAPVNPMAQLRELAEVMFLLNGQKGSAPAGGGTLLEQLQVFKEFRGLAADMVGEGGTGGGGAEDGPAAILKHLSPWAALFARLQGQGGAAARPRPIPPAALAPPVPASSSSVPAAAPAATLPPDPSSIPTPAPAPSGASPAAGVSPVLSQMREQFLVLTQSAASGTDPGSLVPLILNTIPPGSVMESQLIDFLESPTWWQQLTALCPPAAAHSDWFTQLRAGVLAEFEEDSPG